ncbi:MAG: tRNA 2-selenouridine(34) synthase MnmH [Paracoccaceae bacterium]|nr:tRNA 2-selenouridine(34) synthase MnmH [Paracoccaceae bacterium]MDG1736386.1 tRNA 2-selenouridine(34) synthase MnmH [Paracoccaceae bacterium]MDG2258872.1 tRNA 2-selenouridine(34) synthase MnmH [Paracoccaceae bacterium]
MTALNQLSDLSQWDFDDIIDVRSPSEFAEDHIPGAINLPVLSDKERAIVGTVYVQEERFKARKIGAALVARNAADHVENALAGKGGEWRPLVHCWRGGQRSGSFASILAQIGWRTELLEGGYKAYRRLVVDYLYRQPLQHRLILLDGNTGTAKTDILKLLEKSGVQVLDLEGMAAHRGSLFGAVDVAQPTQKMFEGQLAKALLQMDIQRPVLVEAESNKIGDILIPTSFWKAMIAAPRITIKAPLEARSRYLLRSYSDLTANEALLRERIEKLQFVHSKDQISEWLGNVDEGQYQDLAAGLMSLHYDPRYAKNFDKRDRRELGTVQLKSLDEQTLMSKAAPEIAQLIEQYD